LENIWHNVVARVTQAHELCHLLLDRGHGFTAVEVLQSRMPIRIEQRARAFAAEFLLPAPLAIEIWMGAGKPFEHVNLDRLLRQLSRRFGVSRSVAGWQLEHGASQYDREDLSAALDDVILQRGDESTTIMRTSDRKAEFPSVPVPPHPVTPADLQWLAVRRATRRDATEDAGTLVSRMRDEEQR
jgi:hypothetical protein